MGDSRAENISTWHPTDGRDKMSVIIYVFTVGSVNARDESERYAACVPTEWETDDHLL